MELKPLSREQTARLYRDELIGTFPKTELKPLEAIEWLTEQGNYLSLGLYRRDELLSYALLWADRTRKYALLDYLGTVKGQRNRGLGAQLLSLLRAFFRARGYRAILVEMEDPDEAAEEGERRLRLRRADFYHRNGLREAGYDSIVFGVRYRVLELPLAPNVTGEEILRMHRELYGGDPYLRRMTRFVLPAQPPDETPALPPDQDEQWKEK